MVLTVWGFAMRDWLPPAASRHAEGMDAMIRYLLLTTGVVFVIGHAVLIRFIWKYGRGASTEAPRTNPRAERLWSTNESTYGKPLLKQLVYCRGSGVSGC